MRRANTERDKEQRRGTILRAATVLLDRAGWSGVTMAAVAREAGIAKGTTYLYFSTKEQLFLALLEDEYAAWFGAARMALRALPPGAPLESVAEALVGTVRERERLLALMELLHAVLERNVPDEAARAFRGRVRDEVTGLSLVLSEVTGVPMDAAGRLLLHLHAFVVGLRQLTRPGPVLQVAFEPELRVVVRALLGAAQEAA